MIVVHFTSFNHLGFIFSFHSREQYRHPKVGFGATVFEIHHVGRSRSRHKRETIEAAEMKPYATFCHIVFRTTKANTILYLKSTHGSHITEHKRGFCFFACVACKTNYYGVPANLHRNRLVILAEDCNTAAPLHS